MNESNIQRIIRKAISPYGTYFRTNVGLAWTGNDVFRAVSPVAVTLNPGDVLIRQARPFDTGLPKGTSDLNGMTRVVVTPAMVGVTLAVFTAIEVKQPRGRLTDEQSNYLRAVVRAGGLAGVARSAEEAVAIVRGEVICP